MLQRKTIRQVLLTNTLLVATLACVLTGGLWITQEIMAFNASVASLSERLHSARKERMKKEVDAAVAYLEFMRSKVDERTRRVIRERTHFLRKGVKRLVMELELEDVVIFIVHLALGRRTRAAQLADLARLAGNARKPYLIAGDFNAFAGKVELRDFMANLKLASANLSDLPTFPSRAPRWQLDFILHSPAIRVTHFEVARDVRLSDHLPLICDFEIRPPARLASA